MNQKYLKCNLVGFIFVSILGTLLHFAYDWSGQNKIVGLFTPVNESTWEHMKLLFFPILLFGLLSWLFSNKSSNELTATNVAALVGIIMIPVLFYTYRGVLGFGISILDIGTFFLSTAIAFWVRHRELETNHFEKSSLLTFIIVALFWIGFFCFSYHAPNLGIFISPT